MAVNYRDSIAQTRMYLDEVSEKSWSETEVEREVNYGYQSFVTNAMTAYEDFYMIRSDFDLQENVQEYGVADGVPSDVFKIRRIELNYKITSNPDAFRKSVPININDVKSSITRASFGSASFPAYYTYGFDSSFKLGFVPIPTEDGTNAARLWYIQQQVKLVVPTDLLNIPYADRYANGVALIAAGTLLRKGQQEEVSAEKYLIQGENLRMDMQQDLEDRVSDEAKLITDSIGMDLDFTQPF